MDTHTFCLKYEPFSVVSYLNVTCVKVDVLSWTLVLSFALFLPGVGRNVTSKGFGLCGACAAELSSLYDSHYLFPFI